MNGGREILTRARHPISFSNKDMDFNLTWVLGYPISWAEVIVKSSSQPGRSRTGMLIAGARAFQYLRERAATEKAAGGELSAGLSQLGACFAFRTSLQYADPGEPKFAEAVSSMEAAFPTGVALLRIPLRSIEAPFEQMSPPGYYLEIDSRPRPTLVMAGGGDTFREDLFYF